MPEAFRPRIAERLSRIGQAPRHACPHDGSRVHKNSACRRRPRYLAGRSVVRARPPYMRTRRCGRASPRSHRVAWATVLEFHSRSARSRLRRFAVSMAKRPVFVEPADVPDLPEHGIDDRQHRPHQLLGRQVFRQTTGARADVAQLSGQLVGCRPTRRPIYEGLVHADHHYHTGPFVVTVREWYHDRPMGADPARARP